LSREAVAADEEGRACPAAVNALASAAAVLAEAPSPPPRPPPPGTGVVTHAPRTSVVTSPSGSYAGGAALSASTTALTTAPRLRAGAHAARSGWRATRWLPSSANRACAHRRVTTCTAGALPSAGKPGDRRLKMADPP